MTKKIVLRPLGSIFVKNRVFGHFTGVRPKKVGGGTPKPCTSTYQKCQKMTVFEKILHNGRKMSIKLRYFRSRI